MSAHDLVTGCLIWLSVGSAIWIILAEIGVIEKAFEKMRQREGRPVTLWFAVRASIAAILAWPWFVAIVFRNRKSAWAAFKRVVWR